MLLDVAAAVLYSGNIAGRQVDFEHAKAVTMQCHNPPAELAKISKKRTLCCD